MKKLTRMHHELLGKIWVDTNSVLTSNPPQYNYYKDEFAEHHAGYVFCKDCLPFIGDGDITYKNDEIIVGNVRVVDSLPVSVNVINSGDTQLLKDILEQLKLIHDYLKKQ